MQTSTQTLTDQYVVAVPSQGQRPRLLGQWELVGCEAVGTLSRVYRAKPINGPPDRPASYAVKVLDEQHHENRRAVAMFQREALLGRTVVHPHLISILASHVSEPPYYVVMPWIEGKTLQRELDKKTSFELPAALWVVRQAAEALGALAAAGWRHGDVKPSNLFLSADGHVTLLDLGLARRDGETDSIVDRCVTGTYQYIAPESMTSTLAGDIRSDIYSLGVVLFEMLSGRRPLTGDSPAEIIESHQSGRTLDLRRLVPQLPSGVIHLVRQMLAKEPLRRPQTPGELVEQITRLEVLSFAERSV